MKPTIETIKAESRKAKRQRDNWKRKALAYEAEAIMLRSMCRAAADEISRAWTAHCDGEGYGPSNLMRRLEGGFAPSLYTMHADGKDCARFCAIADKIGVTP
jgi:hypothetical protein